MPFLKTDKARDELRPGRRTLGQRERALLLMADGRHTLTDFGALFGGRQQAGRMTEALVRQGYLSVGTSRPVAPARAASTPAPGHQPAPVSADNFGGKRSLATTRMFLFDLCERMFARRTPELSARLRDALREARDRDSMLAVAEAMIADIAQHAGPERAASVRERIDMLLPEEEEETARH